MPRFRRDPFDVATEIGTGGVRLVLAGELDLATTPSLVHQLRRAERSNPATLELDLSEVTFVDVAGLTAMLAAARRAGRAGRRLCVSHARPSVRRLFELTALDQSIELLVDSPFTRAAAWR